MLFGSANPTPSKRKILDAAAEDIVVDDPIVIGACAKPGVNGDLRDHYEVVNKQFKVNFG